MSSARSRQRPPIGWHVVDEYTMRDKRRYRVVNPITSTFEFHGEKFARQTDDCNSVDWARQAMGPLVGSVIGRVDWLRRLLAMRKLRKAYPAAFRVE